MNEYFECLGCRQVVQGWMASQLIACCDKQDYIRIYPDNGEVAHFAEEIQISRMRQEHAKEKEK